MPCRKCECECWYRATHSPGCAFTETNGRECGAPTIAVGDAYTLFCVRHCNRDAPPWPFPAPPPEVGSPLHDFRRRSEHVVAGRWFAGVPFDGVHREGSAHFVELGGGKVAAVTAGEWIVTRADRRREVWTDEAFRAEFEAAS